MKSFIIVKALIFILVSISLASCTSLNGGVGSYLNMDTDLQVDFVVDADINPDEMDMPSPLFVRMYELKSQKMMMKADFIDIYERDKEVLGADMVAVHKLKRFKPGESRTENFVLDKSTHYVAFYAEFLSFNDSKYKVILPVVASNLIQTSATVKVSGNVISHDTGESKEKSTNDNDIEKDLSSTSKAAKDYAEGPNEVSGQAKELF